MFYALIVIFVLCQKIFHHIDRHSFCCSHAFIRWKSRSKEMSKAMYCSPFLVYLCFSWHWAFHNFSCSPVWNCIPRTSSWYINHDKYLLLVLQLLGTSCSFYNNNCITNLWAPDFLFMHDFLCTVLYVLITILRTVSNVLFIIINSYKHFKVIK